MLCFNRGMKEKNTSHLDALYGAFAGLKNADEVRRFMTDLCTPGELKAFGERWAIARLLDEDKVGYREISTDTGASTTTVARVARFLRQEPHQGYRLVLDRMKKSSS